MPPKDIGLKGIAGVDEAGRGPMFGPMVICGILLDKDAIIELEKEGVKDSKALSRKRREQLAITIREVALKESIREISATEIDRLRGEKVTLNQIEVDVFALIARELAPLHLFLDAADVNAERFGIAVGESSGLLERGCEIRSEHKADERYAIVGAASILAKVTRDGIIASLHEEYGDFGSGYPSDPKSIKYLEDLLADNSELPIFVRKSWKSVSNRVLKEKLTQSTLEI